MNSFNRELLVLIKEDSNPQVIENAVEQLHQLLFVLERTESLIISHEIVNIQRRKVFRTKKQVNTVLKMPELKPFVFLNNLN